MRAARLLLAIVTVAGLAACDRSGPADPDPAPTGDSAPVPGSTPTPEFADLPAWKRKHLPPEPINGIVKGESYWAVYLATVEGDRVTPKLRRVARLWERREMRPLIRRLDCDRGARTALEIPPDQDYMVVATYFFERESARALSSIVGYERARFAPVRVFCVK